MYDAINKGMKMATGDIIGILNSDDMLDSDDVIESIVRAFEEKNVDSIYGDLNMWIPMIPIRSTRIWKGNHIAGIFSVLDGCLHILLFILNGCCSKNSADMESHYYSAADYEFMARYLFKHRISAYYLPKLIENEAGRTEQ